MPLRILVLEDHADTRVAFKRYLENRGHTVVAAEFLEEGVEKLRTSDVDAIMSDINLPDDSGLDLLARVQPKEPPFAIIISANGSDEDIRRSYAAGFKLHLVKPVNAADIDEFLLHAEEAVSARRAA